MRAILIKPDAGAARHVEVVEYDGDWQSIYSHLSYAGHSVATFTCVDLDDTHTMFVDDEGLLHGPEHFMLWEGYDQPIAGRGLILGVGREGESVDCLLDEEWVRERMMCIGIDELRRMFL
jgi:hypothetical protein